MDITLARREASAIKCKRASRSPPPYYWDSDRPTPRQWVSLSSMVSPRPLPCSRRVSTAIASCCVAAVGCAVARCRTCTGLLNSSQLLLDLPSSLHVLFDSVRVLGVKFGPVLERWHAWRRFALPRLRGCERRQRSHATSKEDASAGVRKAALRRGLARWLCFLVRGGSY